MGPMAIVTTLVTTTTKIILTLLLLLPDLPSLSILPVLQKKLRPNIA